MELLDALWLAAALALDATAVAAARGATGVRAGDALRLAAVFGGFQAGMAAIGWLAGAGVQRWIEPWDHWVAAALLGAIGVKMIVEAVRDRGEGAPDEVPALPWRALLALGVATSLDALAAGVTLPALGAPPAVAIALIGGVTAALSLAGAWIGRAAGARVGTPLEALGGLALIGIGAKILVEHLS